MIAHRSWLRWLSLLVAGVVIAMAVAADHPARADDWPEPAKWANKYPHEGPTRRNFYELPSIRAALVQLVGEQFYRNVILEWAGTSPILVEGNTMLAEECKPHACGDDQITTMVQGRHISVCVYHWFGQTVSDSDSMVDERIWFTEGVDLPIIEQDPRDTVLTGCLFESVEDAIRKLQYARDNLE